MLGDLGGLDLFAADYNGDLEGGFGAEGFHGGGELFSVEGAFLVVFLRGVSFTVKLFETCRRTFGSLLIVGTWKLARVDTLLFAALKPAMDELLDALSEFPICWP